MVGDATGCIEHFVDRDVELDQLTDCYESETGNFIVIYGRRRPGKSEFVRQSIADRDDAVYYQAVESTAQNQLEQFVDTATAQFPSLRNVRRDWGAFLEALGEEDAIVVIDEVPFHDGPKISRCGSPCAGVTVIRADERVMETEGGAV